MCGDGLIGTIDVPNLASSFALSLPSIPMWALIHFTLIFVLVEHSFNAFFRSLNVLFVVRLLFSDLTIAWLSVLIRSESISLS